MSVVVKSSIPTNYTHHAVLMHKVKVVGVVFGTTEICIFGTPKVPRVLEINSFVTTVAQEILTMYYVAPTRGVNFTCSRKAAIALELSGMLFKIRRTAEMKTFLGTYACIGLVAHGSPKGG